MVVILSAHFDMLSGLPYARLLPINCIIPKSCFSGVMIPGEMDNFQLPTRLLKQSLDMPAGQADCLYHNTAPLAAKGGLVTLA